MKLALATIIKIYFFSCLFVTTSFAQFTLLAENFNQCNLPIGWNVNVLGAGTPVYDVGLPVNPYSDGTTIDGTCLLIIDDDAAGNNNHNILQISTPVFDGSHFPIIQLDIDVHFRPQDETTFSIKIFDGVTFYTVRSWGEDNATGNQFSEFEHLTVDLSFYASSTMQLVFEFDDNDVWGWWAGVDNIEVVGLGTGTNVVLETFDNCVVPNAWTTEAQEGDDLWQFGFINNNNSIATSMNGSCFAYFDDDALGENADFSSALLVSEPFSGVDYANFTLEFELIFRKFADLEQVSVWVWDGTEARLVETFSEDVGGPQFDNYEKVQVDLSPFRSQSMQVIFAYFDGQAWAWWVGVDNVKVTGDGQINDLCINAFDLNTGEDCLNGNNFNAIFDGSQPSCSEDNKASLWYSYVADFTGILKIETQADFNDVISVFSGDCGSGNELSCTNRDQFGFIGENLYMDVVSGTSYLIRVSGAQESFGVSKGQLCISAKQVSAYPSSPPNDDCINAVALQMDNPCVVGNNLNGNFNGPQPSLNIKSKADIWYTFIAGTDQEIKVLTAADFADVITIYAGSCGALTEVASNELGQSLKVTGLTIGETYYLQIAGYFATLEGNICVSVETVNPTIATNDLCENATSLIVGGACVEGGNIGADFDGPNPSCTIFSDANIWYQFVAPASGGIKLNTGADFVHTVAIYTGNCNDLSEFVCLNNPTRCDGYIEIGGLTPGQTYYLQIASALNPFGFLEGELCIELIDINSNNDFEALELNVSVNCISDGFGQIEIEAIGGLGAYTFQGNTEQDTFETGEHFIVIVTDENNCEISRTGMIDCGQIPCTLNTSLSSLDVSCFGENNGQASVEVLDGQAPFIYQWSNGSTNSIINGLGPGTFTLNISDTDGCVGILSVNIQEPAILLANISATGESASNMNDGSATIDPIGGIEPYTVLWSTGVSTQSIENLIPGIYSVTLTDDNDCEIIESIVVSDFDCALSIESIVGEINCNGANDGFIEVYPQGGAVPFSFEWNTGATTDVVSNLGPGTYTVTVFDGIGCPWVENYTLTEPSDLSLLETEMIPADCFGNNTGSASVAAFGGTAPYTFTWSNGGVGATQVNLTAGNYIVTVSDANECNEVNIIEVTQPNAVNPVSINPQDVSCFGDDNGIGSVIVNGGTAPYFYQWDDPAAQITAQAINLAPGVYNVEVTDFYGCTGTTTVTINEPNEIVININSVFDETSNQNNGGVNVTVLGGVAPLSFNWILNGTSVSTDEDPEGLTAGSYILEVTDGNGCVVQSESVVIDNLVGVSDPELDLLIEVLPNPTEGKFQLKMAFEHNEKVRILITDVSGKILIEMPTNQIRDKVFDFDLSEYAAAVYPIKIYVGGKVVLKQVLIQR